MKRRPSSEEELEAYFTGRLEGAMGLRSWLGPWVERRSPQGIQSSASPPEPGAVALLAAREMDRVEGALALAGRTHARVLEARFTPRGPYAPLASYGELAGVLHLLEADITALFDADADASLREALRTGSANDARLALEVVAPRTLLGRLLQLEGADRTVLRRPDVRRARRTRAQLKSLAGRAVDRAMVAYQDGRERWTRIQRTERLQRLRRGLDL